MNIIDRFFTRRMEKRLREAYWTEAARARALFSSQGEPSEYLMRVHNLAWTYATSKGFGNRSGIASLLVNGSTLEREYLAALAHDMGIDITD